MVIVLKSPFSGSAWMSSALENIKPPDIHFAEENVALPVEPIARRPL